MMSTTPPPPPTAPTPPPTAPTPPPTSITAPPTAPTPPPPLPVKPEPSTASDPSTPAAAASPSPDPTATATSYTITIPSCAAWFSYTQIHDTERRLLPQFFQNPNPRSSTYIYFRNSIVRQFRANPSRKLSFTDARKGLVGDVGSIRRVFDFLEDWGLINYTPSSSGSGAGKEKREDEVSTVGEKDGGGARVCFSCRGSCTLTCFVTEKADITFCARCFVNGKYRPGLNASDFKRIDMNEETKTKWTDKETLHLLEAVLHYGDDWKKVADHVGGRSEKDCVARFIKLPFAEQFLGPCGTTLDGLKLESEEKIYNMNGGNYDSEQLSLKRRRLTPLADASNPIMAQVAFLSSVVGSDVAKSAAQAAITAMNKCEIPSCSITEVPKVVIGEAKNGGDQPADKVLKKAAKEAWSLLEKEENDVQQYLSDIVEVQMKEIQEKIQNFEESELLLEKERQQLRYMKDLSFADQLGLIQHQQSKTKNK